MLVCVGAFKSAKTLVFFHHPSSAAEHCRDNRVSMTNDVGFWQRYRVNLNREFSVFSSRAAPSQLPDSHNSSNTRGNLPFSDDMDSQQDRTEEQRHAEKSSRGENTNSIKTDDQLQQLFQQEENAVDLEDDTHHSSAMMDNEEENYYAAMLSALSRSSSSSDFLGDDVTTL
jgi:hypothetical protein